MDKKIIFSVLFTGVLLIGCGGGGGSSSSATEQTQKTSNTLEESKPDNSAIEMPNIGNSDSPIHSLDVK